MPIDFPSHGQDLYQVWFPNYGSLKQNKAEEVWLFTEYHYVFSARWKRTCQSEGLTVLQQPNR
uniref:Beta-glucosidase 11-like isoform X2 n=1 Tax=Rhizophora mucronata TaxID=61149 RepID=A0A2P2LXW0_RHIMU